MNHYTRWLELKEENPGKYARDIAGLMNISEAELTFARVGHDAWRLRGDVREIPAALEAVGETKCICRNDYAVHEQVGAFTHQHLSGHAGLILNPRALDLRLFLNQWASVFHISEATAHGERQSIQFFDHQGDALLKVYATDNTDLTAWGDLLTRFIFAGNPPLALKTADVPAHAENPDASLVDTEWRAMTDVHQFFSLLKRHNLSRQQAFRLVGDDLACRVDNTALAQLLETARRGRERNHDFRRQPRRLRADLHRRGGKTDADEGLAEHLQPGFHPPSAGRRHRRIWVTRKPTADGHVTSRSCLPPTARRLPSCTASGAKANPSRVSGAARSTP